MPMTNAVVRAIRFWAYPAILITLWVVISAFSLTQLATILPSLASPVPCRRRFRTAPMIALREVAWFA